MIQRLALLALAVLLIGGVWLMAPFEKRAVTSSLTTPFVYGQEDVTKFLRKNGIEVEVVEDVRRNASGTALFVYLFDSPTNRFSVLKITTNALIRLTAPGRGTAPGFGGDFVAWGSETGSVIHFQNDRSFELPQFGLFEIDPGGTYFIVGEKPHKAWLGRVGFPQKRVMIADDLLPGGVFVSNGRIYITGHSYARNPSRDAQPRTACLILKDEGEEFKIVERLHFDWASGVVEVDPFADRLLLWDRALVSHSVYSYDLVTKQRRKVGRVEGFQFFLVTDLLK